MKQLDLRPREQKIRRWFVCLGALMVLPSAARFAQTGFSDDAPWHFVIIGFIVIVLGYSGGNPMTRFPGGPQSRSR